MESLVTELKAISSLSIEEIGWIEGLSKEVCLDKGTLWVREGKKADKIAFIKKGYLRKYFLKEGKETTDDFYLENSFTADIPSIVTGTPALSNFVAMEPTILLGFSYLDMEELCSHHHTIEHFMRRMIQHAFINFYYRTTSFILNTPMERYRQLIENKSAVLQRATQYHIASYLGITPQHLSRLRASYSIS